MTKFFRDNTFEIVIFTLFAVGFAVLAWAVQS